MKLRADVLRLYRNVHSWVGILCGLILFTCFYAGSITMFESHLASWSAPALSLPEPVSLKQAPTLLEATVAAHPHASEHYEIALDVDETTPRLTWREPDPDAPRNRRKGTIMAASLDAQGTLHVEPMPKNPAASYIDTLHRTGGLPLPKLPATLLVGLVALLYGLALISGLIVLLPSLVRDVFAVRISKNLKKMWLDVHNALGLFSFPFHLVIAITAVAFCLHDPIYKAQDSLLYKGELATLWTKPKVSPHPAATELASPQEVVERMQEHKASFTAKRLSYAKGPSGHMNLTVWGTDREFGMRGPVDTPVRVDPYDGNLLGTDYLPGHRTAAAATVSVLFSLHFGNYGGLAVRWTYVILGLAGALLFFTGNLLWIESRRKRLAGGPRTATLASRRIAAVTVGWSLGVVIGISLVLAAARLLPGRLTSPGLAYNALFYGGLLASLGYSALRGAGRSSYEILWGASLATSLIPMAGGVNGSLSSVDLAATGAALLFAALGVLVRRRLRKGDPLSAWAIPAVATRGTRT